MRGETAPSPTCQPAPAVRAGPESNGLFAVRRGAVRASASGVGSARTAAARKAGTCGPAVTRPTHTGSPVRDRSAPVEVPAPPPRRRRVSSRRRLLRVRSSPGAGDPRSRERAQRHPGWGSSAPCGAAPVRKAGSRPTRSLPGYDPDRRLPRGGGPYRVQTGRRPAARPSALTAGRPDACAAPSPVRRKGFLPTTQGRGARCRTRHRPRATTAVTGPDTGPPHRPGHRGHRSGPDTGRHPGRRNSLPRSPHPTQGPPSLAQGLTAPPPVPPGPPQPLGGDGA